MSTLGFVGRRVAVWHGDVGPTARRRILEEPPEVLLTTPESLEVMLISPRVDHRFLFGDVRVTIADELHAFASDDREWHLLAVLERLGHLAGRDLQRLGLSATVGNPDQLVTWLAGSSRSPRAVVSTGAGFDSSAVVTIDYVGSEQNAAKVIAALHAGEKRLVFCDSRSGAETVAAAVRERGIQTFVSHSSLSADERRKTEQAFAEATNCAIVATSTLELGLDIGDLDRVIQIDAPTQVASLLQRLGRTGRRPGTVRNCLFLARDTAGLVRAMALRELWAQGYVEHIEPPAAPMHLFAQQILALCLQERGLPHDAWPAWIGGHPGFAKLTSTKRQEILDFMFERRFLFEDEGVWSLGGTAEEEFGRRYFLDLVSAFAADALFTVKHGEVEIGSVHHLTFALRRDGPAVLLLGGRPWVVQDLDWQARVAYVLPTNEPGQSRWLGDGVPLGFPLCQAIAGVLSGETSVPADALTKRAKAALDEVRLEYGWLDPARTSVTTRADGTVEWWTFAGARANATLAASLGQHSIGVRRFDNFSVAFVDAGPTSVSDAIGRVRSGEWPLELPPVTDEALDGLKFSACLPVTLAKSVLQQRAKDAQAVEWVKETPHVVIGGHKD